MTDRHSVIIRDGDDQYTCNARNKDTAIQFLGWFLDGVRGNTELQIAYRQAGEITPEMAHQGTRKEDAGSHTQ